jgi:hypothetical protein
MCINSQRDLDTLMRMNFEEIGKLIDPFYNPFYFNFLYL